MRDVARSQLRQLVVVRLFQEEHHGDHASGIERSGPIRLRHWAEVERCELVLTSGGTGLAPSDVTPEATLAVIDREVPGIAEAMRGASREHTPNWMLSRAVAGVRGSCLVINFPGSPRSIEQTGAALRGAIAHALALLAGEGSGH